MTVKLHRATRVKAPKHQVTHVGRQLLQFRGEQLCQDCLEDTQLPFTNGDYRITLVVIPMLNVDIAYLKFPNIS